MLKVAISASGFPREIIGFIQNMKTTIFFSFVIKLIKTLFIDCKVRIIPRNICTINYFIKVTKGNYSTIY